MIDPRGMFGETKYYGDPYYDLAKFLTHAMVDMSISFMISLM